MTMRTVVLIALLALIVAAAAAAGVAGWLGVAEAQVTGHGVFALVLGAVLSLAMGGGLMFLVFFSSRRGHDDDAGRPD